MPTAVATTSKTAADRFAIAHGVIDAAVTINATLSAASRIKMMSRGCLSTFAMHCGLRSAMGILPRDDFFCQLGFAEETLRATVPTQCCVSLARRCSRIVRGTSHVVANGRDAAFDLSLDRMSNPHPPLNGQSAAATTLLIGNGRLTGKRPLNDNGPAEWQNACSLTDACFLTIESATYTSRAAAYSMIGDKCQPTSARNFDSLRRYPPLPSNSRVASGRAQGRCSSRAASRNGPR